MGTNSEPKPCHCGGVVETIILDRDEQVWRAEVLCSGECANYVASTGDTPAGALAKAIKRWNED